MLCCRRWYVLNMVSEKENVTTKDIQVNRYNEIKEDSVQIIFLARA